MIQVGKKERKITKLKAIHEIAWMHGEKIRLKGLFQLYESYFQKNCWIFCSLFSECKGLEVFQRRTTFM